VLGRGSVQLSSYLDQVLASLLGASMVSAMGYAQVLAVLPVSLFGMAVSAAELPAMSGELGAASEVAARLRERLRSALRRVVFLVVPSAVAFVAIGGAVVTIVLKTGHFAASDVRVVWIILAGSAVGLSAGTQGRLLNSAFYALRDTRSPLYAALVRVAITFALGWIVVMALRETIGPDDVALRPLGGWMMAVPLRNAGSRNAWAAFALVASAGVAAWVEFALLRRWLAKKIGEVPIPARLGLGALAAAAVAGALGGGVWWLFTQRLGVNDLMTALLVIALYGGAYFGITAAAGVPESSTIVRRVLRRRRASQ